MWWSSRFPRSFLAAFAIVAHGSFAHAQLVLFSPGIAVGAAGGGDVNVFGVEASAVWTPSLPHSSDVPMPIIWGGGYVDGVWDGDVSRGRFSIGPELGLGPIGVDGGLVMQTAGSPVGGTFRLLGGIGFIMGYARWLYIDDPRSDSPVHEYGVLVKLPLFEIWPGRSHGEVPRAMYLRNVQGTLVGLAEGALLELRNNGTDALTLTENRAFTFPTSIHVGDAYVVTVASQPADQHCSVANGSGIVGDEAVTNVAVTCVPKITGE